MNESDTSLANNTGHFNLLTTPAGVNELKEVLISKRLKSLNGNVACVDQGERQELEMYLRQVAAVGGNLAKAARQLKIKRTTLHMRIKRLQRGD